MNQKKASPLGSQLPPYEAPAPDPEVDLSWLPPDLQPGADLGDPNRPNLNRLRVDGEYAGKPEGLTWGDFMLVPGRPLTPRHRRLCQLLATGMNNEEVALNMGYSDPQRISVLRSNTLIMREVARLQEKVFEETIADRMKDLGTSALDVLESAVRDETSKFKSSERLSAAQWIVEKLDGKATQKTDIGENLLSVLMDRLDAKKTAAPRPQVIDVTAERSPLPGSGSLQIEEPKQEEVDPLKSWVSDFAAR